MSCYSVPKCLLHILFAGSAIWLGTTFCSPLAATDLELPPAQASAPDALAAPEQTVQRSIVPAASLEAEETDHWDTGPVVEDALWGNEYVCEDGYCDFECYGEHDNTYDYAAPEDAYAGNAAGEEAGDESAQTPCIDDSWSYDNTCCDEYAYDDEYYDDYGYDEEYVYDGSEMNSFEEQSQEAAETPVASDVDSNPADDFSYEFDDYEMYYGYEDDDVEVAEEATTTEQEATEEVAESYESDWEDYYYEDDEMYYGYEDDVVEVAEEAATTEQEATEEVAESYESDWEDYYYEDDEMYYGYEDDVVEVAEEAATTEQATEEVAESYESDWEDYYYEDDEMYYGFEDDVVEVAEEAATTEQEATEEVAESYESDWEDYYCEDDEMYYGYEDDVVEVAEEAATTEQEAAEEVAESYESDWEDYCYEDDEMYHEYEDEVVEVAEEAATTEQEATEEVAESYESDWEDYYYEDDEMYYGYEDDSVEVAEEAATTEQEAAEEVAESYESDWEDYYYEDEYDSQSEVAAEETADAETDAEEAWADEYKYEYDEYEYDTYEYDANDYDYSYDMEDAYGAETATDEPAAPSDDSYDYADPMDYYGYEYKVPEEWNEIEADEETKGDLDLFAWQPTELLHDADCDLIRSIERLSGQPAAMRRACLNEYIEALGFEAIDFAYRYEDATDSDVLTLADDLPSAVAFLASFRLLEQGQVGMDDGALLLQDSLSGLSLDWIEEVGRITAPDKHTVSASHPVVDAMAAAATHSIAGVSALATTVSARLAELPWAEISDRLEQVWSAQRPPESDDAFIF